MPFATRTRPRRAFRIRYALAALATAIVFGTIGFHFVERWSIADSLYVTVQTLTTVGYGDLPPRSGARPSNQEVARSPLDGCDLARHIFAFLVPV